MSKITVIGNMALLVLVLAFVSCKKEDPVSVPVITTPASTSATSSPQFTGSIDGIVVNYLNGYVGYSSGGTLGTGTPSDFRYGGVLLNGATLSEVLNVEKGNLNLPSGGYATNAEFGNFFPLGNYGFDASLLNGIVLTYYSGGTEWSTSLGSGDQTGSTFTVVDRLETTVAGDFVVKYKATFNCKIYDGSGAEKLITNGVLVSAFSNI
ncbi:MAG: hypothetical protein ACI837_001342 [Crocinitomicaceae bacterium]|jgi:hypothetical protein